MSFRSLRRDNRSKTGTFSERFPEQRLQPYPHHEGKDSRAALMKPDFPESIARE
jgi:hypothetical protein